MFKKIQKIYLIGIGGAGMSGIAEVLLNRGYLVGGSDLRLSSSTERLILLGASINQGHVGGHLDGADVVVVSSAISSNNPELSEARRRKIPIIPRAEMLAELMKMKYGITVAGTHGKTTTTSMVATVLGHGGMDPTVVLGGRLNAFGSNAKLGAGEFMVVEADESDRSFLLLSPTLVVMTNIDEDHMECYSGIDDLKNTFVQFVNKVPFYGAVVLCWDEDAIRSIIPQIKRRIISYGFSPGSDLHVTEASYLGFRSEFRLDHHGQTLGKFKLNMPGKHNILNAVAAVSVGLDLGISPQVLRSSLARFTGPDRRFQLKGQVHGVTLIDDYGHHPTEISATLEAARYLRGKRLVVIFQPHRYSRTQYCFEAFAQVFHEAHLVVLTDIYAAGEDPIDDLNSAELVRAIRRNGHRNAHYFGGLDETISKVIPRLKTGDIVITMGAGNISKVGEALLKKLA